MSVTIKSLNPFAFDPRMLYRLEENHVSGDIISIQGRRLIITDESNDVTYLGKENEWRNRFYAGKWITVFDLEGIFELESDEPIDIEGFKRFPCGEHKLWTLIRMCRKTPAFRYGDIRRFHRCQKQRFRP